MNEFEASRYQKRFYLEWQLDPDSPKYNTYLIYQLNGKLNRPALLAALGDFVNDYFEGCRSRFFEKNSIIYQAVFNRVSVLVEESDISSFDDKDKDAFAFIDHIIGHVFDLSAPPLFKFGLLKKSDEENVLVLTFHHIITDGHVAELISSTISGLYNHHVFGDQKPEVINLSMRDYVTYEQDNYTGKQAEEDLQYWSDHLKNSLLFTDLNFKQPQTLGEKSGVGESVYFKLDKTDALRFKRAAKGLHSSPFVVFSTLYGILLARYTGNEAIVMNYPINMCPPKFNKLLGSFVNNLVMIYEYNKNMSLAQCVFDMTRQRKQAKIHQKCSLTDIVQRLAEQKKHKGGYHLFNVGVMETALKCRDEHLLKLRDIQCISLQPKAFALDGELDLAYEISDEIEFRLDYASHLFLRQQMECFAEHFKNLLLTFLENTEQKVGEVSYLSKNEGQKILMDWNKTESPYPKDKTIVQLFEEQAEKTPNNIAVIFEDKKITFQELNAKSNQMAQYLCENGASLDALIGVYVERSINMAIAILAVLKTGAAYIPLDPAYPQKRVDYILNDARPLMLITERGLVDENNNFGMKIIYMDAEKNFDHEATSNLSCKSRPNSLIYAIYTSGSTGDPKGVMIEHKAVINLLYDMQAKLKLKESDKTLSLTTFSFDIWALEFYLPLITGGTCVIGGVEESKDPGKIKGLLSKNKITFMQATPATWSLLINSGWQGNKKLVVTCGGEALSKELAKNLYDKVGAYWNVYGPTETTIWSTGHYINVRPGFEKTISIGRPISNTKVYVLDKNNQALPGGVFGELYIGGDGLARGYLNQPELTEEKFIKNPFSDDSNSRLYKTGDLVRWLPDGNLEFIGRNDFQVKIRGFRVELGEIESQLNQHAAVNQCVVTVYNNDTLKIKQIAAYYIAKQEVSADALRKYLLEWLPDYMIPTYFIALDKMPINANGKVDRKSLPSPNTDLLESRQYVAPRNKIEKTLVKIWEDVLGLKKVGITDNFFSMGGNSILSIQVVAKASDQKIKITPKRMFEHQTIKALAETFCAPMDSDVYKPMLAFNENGKKPPIFFVHPLFAGAEIFREFASLFDSDQPFYSVEHYNLYSGDRLLKTIESIAAKYIEYIRLVCPHGPYFLGGYSLGGTIAYEMAQQLQNEGEEVEKLYLLDQLPWQLSGQKEKNMPEQKGLERDYKKLYDQIFGGLSRKVKKHVISVQKLEHKALQHYVAASYSGDVELFKAEKTVFSLLSKTADLKKHLPQLKSHSIPGNHFDMIKPDNLRKIAEIILG